MLLILWLALRSWRIILAAAVSLFCGLAISAALGLYLVGTLNLISVAFFVLFVGLGVDFGIQFSVRYRAERHDIGALRPALVSAARKAGGPLALAAAATAIGFASFVPTAYRGLSELGEIAGLGMIVAFLTSITLLPALLTVLNPPGEVRAMGFTALAPVDRFLQRYRIAVVAATLGVVVLAAPLLYWLPFDFNPLHLQDPKAEAVATYLELRRDPQTGANAIEIVKPDLKAADTAAQRIAGLPDVLADPHPQQLCAGRPGQEARRDPADGGGARSGAQAAAAYGAADRPAGRRGLAIHRPRAEQFAAASPGQGASAAQHLSGLLNQSATADASMRQRATPRLSRRARRAVRTGRRARPATRSRSRHCRPS